MYAHVAVVVVAAVVAVVVVVDVAAAVAAATVVDAVVSVAARPAVAAVVVVAAAAAVSAQGDSRERWNQSAVVLVVAECLALCYSEVWTVVATPLLTTLTR